MKWHAPQLLVLALGLFLLPGCSSEEHDDHLEHHIPEHKPADFSRAVTEIQRRTDELRIADKFSPADRATKVNELFDIIRWLPELAGESDMPEEPWNKVNAISRSLAAALEPQRQTGAGNAEVPFPAPDLWDKAINDLSELVPLSRSAAALVEDSHGS